MHTGSLTHPSPDDGEIYTCTTVKKKYISVRCPTVSVGCPDYMRVSVGCPDYMRVSVGCPDYMHVSVGCPDYMQCLSGVSRLSQWDVQMITSNKMSFIP